MKSKKEHKVYNFGVQRVQLLCVLDMCTLLLLYSKNLVTLSDTKPGELVDGQKKILKFGPQLWPCMGRK
jgi:hypothetical protein